MKCAAALNISEISVMSQNNQALVDKNSRYIPHSKGEGKAIPVKGREGP
jgi:hypothetical protein